MPDIRDYGFSDPNDFAVAVGTLMGEARGQGLLGKAGVADVIANRMTDTTPGHNYSRFGNSFSAQALAGQRRGSGGQFTTWSSQYGGSAYVTANAFKDLALQYALDPDFAIDDLPASDQWEFKEALSALKAVFGTGELRGVTQGAIQYSNLDEVDRANRDRVLASMAKGYISIEDHDFYEGQNFNPARDGFDRMGALRDFLVNSGALDALRERIQTGPIAREDWMPLQMGVAPDAGFRRSDAPPVMINVPIPMLPVPDRPGPLFGLDALLQPAPKAGFSLGASSPAAPHPVIGDYDFAQGRNVSQGVAPGTYDPFLGGPFGISQTNVSGGVPAGSLAPDLTGSPFGLGGSTVPGGMGRGSFLDTLTPAPPQDVMASLGLRGFPNGSAWMARDDMGFPIFETVIGPATPSPAALADPFLDTPGDFGKARGMAWDTSTRQNAGVAPAPAPSPSSAPVAGSLSGPGYSFSPTGVSWLDGVLDGVKQGYNWAEDKFSGWLAPQIADSIPKGVYDGILALGGGARPAASPAAASPSPVPAPSVASILAEPMRAYQQRELSARAAAREASLLFEDTKNREAMRSVTSYDARAHAAAVQRAADEMFAEAMRGYRDQVAAYEARERAAGRSTGGYTARSNANTLTNLLDSPRERSGIGPGMNLAGKSLGHPDVQNTITARSRPAPAKPTFETYDKRAREQNPASKFTTTRPIADPVRRNNTATANRPAPSSPTAGLPASRGPLGINAPFAGALVPSMASPGALPSHLSDLVTPLAGGMGRYGDVTGRLEPATGNIFGDGWSVTFDNSQAGYETPGGGRFSGLDPRGGGNDGDRVTLDPSRRGGPTGNMPDGWGNNWGGGSPFGGGLLGGPMSAQPQGPSGITPEEAARGALRVAIQTGAVSPGAILGLDLSIFGPGLTPDMLAGLFGGGGAGGGASDVFGGLGGGYGTRGDYHHDNSPGVMGGASPYYG